MANYYTEWSEVLSLTEEQTNWVKSVIEDYCLDEDECELFEWSIDHEQLWCHSEYGGVDAFIDFVQVFLEKFAPEKYVTVSWAHTCGKPRAGAFGGGAAFITAHGANSVDSSMWLRGQIRQFKSGNYTVEER